MKIIDLSQTMHHGLETYKGLPAIHVCDYLSREHSKALYGDHETFQIDTVTLVGNSGTYIDSPFHRYENGRDLAELALSATTALPTVVIRAPYARPWHGIDEKSFSDREFAGKAVLFDTGWSRHFGRPDYFEGHPFLTASAADLLHKKGVTLVGIDSHNIDDTRTNTRPVHSILLGADIPIVEHMTNLSALPDLGARFFAAPLKFRGVGTFPTRAYAIIDQDR